MDEKEKNMIESWYKKAKEVTPKTLPQFIEELTSQKHSYDSITHAVVAGAIAGAYSIENSKVGRITGFQASFIDIYFIKEWGVRSSPFGIIQYKDLLYPQYDYKFKTIPKHIFKEIQEKAKQMIKEDDNQENNMLKFHKKLRKHLESIIEGNIPFGLEIEKD
jgi:hypothetical protein